MPQYTFIVDRTQTICDHLIIEADGEDQAYDLAQRFIRYESKDEDKRPVYVVEYGEGEATSYSDDIPDITLSEVDGDPCL